MAWKLPKEDRRRFPDEVWRRQAAPRVDPLLFASLGNRLGMVATLVKEGAAVLDVGTHHALLPIALLQSGRARRVVASDLNEKPLANARESLAAIARAGDVHSILPRLELRLGDGLDVLAAGEVDTLTISGMGGPVMSHVLFPESGRAPHGAATEAGGSLVARGVSRVVMQPTQARHHPRSPPTLHRSTLH